MLCRSRPFRMMRMGIRLFWRQTSSLLNLTRPLARILKDNLNSRRTQGRVPRAFSTRTIASSIAARKRSRKWDSVYAVLRSRPRRTSPALSSSSVHRRRIPSAISSTDPGSTRTPASPICSEMPWTRDERTGQPNRHASTTGRLLGPKNVGITIAVAPANKPAMRLSGTYPRYTT
jgi:hypothetical protein